MQIPTTGREKSRPEDSPVAWFNELQLAMDRGDIDRASSAKSQLARLGWHVTRCKPRPVEGGAR